MPFHTITTQPGVLGDDAKGGFAMLLTSLHAEYAGVPTGWVHVAFQDYAPLSVYTAGEPAAVTAMSLLIRAGRSPEYKSGLLKQLWRILQAATAAKDDQIVIGIQEAPANQDMEMAQIMPDV